MAYGIAAISRIPARLIGGLLVVLALAGAVLPPPAPAAQEGAREGAQPAGGAVHVLEFEGAVGPATADFVLRALEVAEAADAALFVIRMDTPGGLSDSMRAIIKEILDARVPVATWVAPAGSRAASAGTYILYASHIAAMAPATNLGAATPVSVGGGGGGSSPIPAPDGGAGDGGTPGEAQDEDAESAPTAARGSTALERKAVNDAVAYIRGLAELRGRNAEWAELAVRQAASLTADAAFEAGVIDLLAPDLEALLEGVDGREVELAGGPVRLATAGAEVERVVPDWRNRLLATITNPNIAYILLMVGVYGLILEFYNPGLGIPGVTGVVCLFLGAYAMQMLPIDYAGLGLVGIGLALMLTEAFTPSFGVFGTGGVIAFAFGSIMLFDTDVPAFEISASVVAAFVVASLVLLVWMVGATVRSRRRAPLGGHDEIVGAHAEALEDFSGSGRVRLRGEVWQAKSEAAVQRGETVVVTGLAGLVLTVAPAAATAARTSTDAY